MAWTELWTVKLDFLPSIRRAVFSLFRKSLTTVSTITYYLAPFAVDQISADFFHAQEKNLNCSTRTNNGGQTITIITFKLAAAAAATFCFFQLMAKNCGFHNWTEERDDTIARTHNNVGGDDDEALDNGEAVASGSRVARFAVFAWTLIFVSCGLAVERQLLQNCCCVECGIRLLLLKSCRFELYVHVQLLKMFLISS
jgi:hypothetical protein